MKIINEISKRSIQLLAITGLLMVSLSAQAALDMFLILGDIKGESQDRQYRDAIDVLAWSEGSSNSGSLHIGGGGGAGKVNVQDISLTKYLDSSSPFIRLNVANGKILPSATLIVRTAGENPIVVFKIELTRVMITSVSASGSGGEDRLTENVSLNFAEIEWTYTGRDGKGGTSPITTGWNVAENREK